MLSLRLGLLRGYLARSRDFPFNKVDLLKGLMRIPCTLAGPKFIESVSEEEEFLLVKLRPLPMALYWPRVLPLFDLYKVITECFREDDWHFYEIPETRVSPGDVVLDCGAAEGLFSLRVAQRASRVIAFEPLPLFHSSLQQTFAQVSNVTIVPCALGSHERDAYINGTSLYGHVVEYAGGTPIKIISIDRWVESAASRVDFIKGDLESSEVEVLRGAAETIRRFAPKIALTVYHPGNDWREILGLVRSLVPNYAYRLKGLSFNENKARPVMIHLWQE